VLSLVSSRYDWRLTEQTFKATEDYYAADGQACLWLGDIETVLLEVESDGWSEALAKTAPDAEVTADATGWLMSRRFSIDDRRVLDVAVHIDEDGLITITEWVSSTVRE